MNNSIICVKGVSGSGKSTRVFMFLKFIEEVLGYKLKDFKFLNFENKEKTVGILVEELNLVFIGKKYETNGVVRYQGYDVMTGYFGKSSYFSEFLKSNNQFNFIVEGAGVTGTNRLRPLFLNKYCGFNNILIQYYNYDLDQKEQYQNRIFYRSGKLPNKGTMWDKCSGFISDHRDSLKEIGKLGEEVFSNSFYNSYQSPLYDFGLKALEFLGMDNQKDFIEFCQNSDYINVNSFKNFENGK